MTIVLKYVQIEEMETNQCGYYLGMQAGRRRAQRRRMANNRHQNNESGEIIEPGVEISSGDHFDGDMDDFDCKRFAYQRTFGRNVLNKV